MAREDRPPAFLFEPARFLNDEAVQGMDPSELGAYAALFCACWSQPEVGVLPDDDRILSFLARCSPEEWAAYSPAVRRAFKPGTRDGRPVLIQAGLVATARATARRFAERSKAGREAANARWQSGQDAPGNADAMQVKCSVVKGREVQNPNPSLALGLEGDGNPVAFTSDASWATLWDSFWAAWPSGIRGKPGKAEAREIWGRLKPKGRPLFDLIMAGLERWKSSSEWQKNGGEFIPDAKKWLRRQRWQDEVGPGATGSSAQAWAKEGDGE